MDFCGVALELDGARISRRCEAPPDAGPRTRHYVGRIETGSTRAWLYANTEEGVDEYNRGSPRRYYMRSPLTATASYRVQDDRTLRSTQRGARSVLAVKSSTIGKCGRMLHPMQCEGVGTFRGYRERDTGWGSHGYMRSSVCGGGNGRGFNEAVF